LIAWVFQPTKHQVETARVATAVVFVNFFLTLVGA